MKQIDTATETQDAAESVQEAGQDSTHEPTATERANALLDALGEESEQTQAADAPADTTSAQAEEQSEEQPKEPSQAERKRSKLLSDLAAKELRALEARAKLKAEREEFERDRSEWQSTKALATSDPIAFLERAGVDLQALTQAILGKPAKDVPPKVDPEIAKLRQEVDRLKGEQEQSRSEYQQSRIAAAVRADQEACAEYVRTKADAYPFLADESPEDVGEAMHEIRKRHWMRTHTELDPSAAAAELERRISAQYDRLAKAAAKRSQPSPAARAPALSSRTRESARSIEPKDMTPEERRAAALDLLSKLE